MRQENEKQRISTSSKLLTPDENETVFSLLGQRRVAMSTAVIQLFTTEPPAHNVWTKRSSGVACFVKDHVKKAYFIRVYDMMRHEMIWEEEMYKSISLNKPRDYLITFEGQQSIVALSFAEHTEADHFYKIASNTVSNRSKKRHSRKSIPVETEKPKENGANPFTGLQNSAAGMASYFQKQQNSVGLNKKNKNRKINKSDISSPFDFQHLYHLGWDDKKLNGLFEKAGVSKQQLADETTRNYIIGFVRDYNSSMDIEDAGNQQNVAPPPVPIRNLQHRTPPPPPPSQNTQSKPAPQIPISKPAPPNRPPPMKIDVNAAATVTSPPSRNQEQMNIPAPPAPPPPPMPSFSLSPTETSPASASAPTSAPAPAPTKPMAPINDAQNALMESIRKGITLRKTETKPCSRSTDARTDLLSEIRQGVGLRSATQRDSEIEQSATNTGTDQLADALHRALADRFKKITMSDDENSSNNEEDDDWDD